MRAGLSDQAGLETLADGLLRQVAADEHDLRQPLLVRLPVALDVAVESHGELVPTESARALLRGERAFLLREAAFRMTPAARGARAADRTPPPSDDPVFGALREWRKAQARTQQVPAYVIFHDATLREIALNQPGTLDELGEISGVGARKLEAYGADILQRVARPLV